MFNDLVASTAFTPRQQSGENRSLFTLILDSHPDCTVIPDNPKCFFTVVHFFIITIYVGFADILPNISHCFPILERETTLCLKWCANAALFTSQAFIKLKCQRATTLPNSTAASCVHGSMQALQPMLALFPSLLQIRKINK